MKLIQAMKQLKQLNVKVADLQAKIKAHAADMDFETPVYPEQAKQVAEWLQSAQDTTKEILRLRVAIQRTNLATPVTIELGGVQVTKSIAEWIHRRRDLAKLDQTTWAMLTDGNRKEGTITQSNGEKREVKIRRYYDPRVRDEKVALFMHEPSIVDATLEVVNAVTDLIEG